MKYIARLMLFFLTAHVQPGLAQSDFYFNGCQSFYNSAVAKNYYQVSRLNNQNVFEPKMVNYGAGMSLPWSLDHNAAKTKLIINLNQLIATNVIDRALNQAVDIFYMIKSQRALSFSHVNHELVNLPTLIASHFCKNNQCDTEALETKIAQKIDGKRRMSYARYSFSEIAENLSFLVSSLNLKIYGVFAMTRVISKRIGAPLTREEFYAKKMHNEKLHQIHIENAYEEYTYFINSNWGLENNIIFKSLNADYSDMELSSEETLLEVVNSFNILAQAAPEALADVFSKNEKYQNSFCEIYDIVDNATTNLGMEKSSINADWYMSPLLLGMLFIPAIMTGGAFVALPALFWSLTAITAADLSYKLYIHSKTLEEVNSYRAINYVSKRNPLQIKQMFELQKAALEQGNTIKTLLMLELIGLGIASKVVKIAEKVYKKMSRADVISEFTYLFKNSNIESAMRRFFWKKNINSVDDLTKHINSLSEKELYDFLVHTKSMSVGKIIAGSEMTIEAAKLGYVYSTSGIYLEVNPITIMMDAITHNYENKLNQRELEESVRYDL